MVLDPRSFDLAPRAGELLSEVAGDPRFKPELVAAQVELVTTPCRTVGEAAVQLREGRERLAEAAAGKVALAAAGVHPFTSEEGVLNDAWRYAHTRSEYGWVARRQLVFGLHVHVRVSGAERAVAVYNALRSYLPEIAGLAANAPFYAGEETGLASIRPKISEKLPRQGVPPPLARLEDLAEALSWGTRAGVLAEPRTWWWELRLHPIHGTVELRVPDQQSTVGETAAVAAVAHSLIVHLARRYDDGERFESQPTWRIEENRWSACRHGLGGAFADLATGEPRPARQRAHDLLSELEDTAGRIGCLDQLAAARELVERSGAERQREAGSDGGAQATARWLAARFSD
jgi:glutamate---cysteine ligase / carboxylate-amine ligase